MKVLGIETSSPLFSLSVNDDGKVVYEIRKSRVGNTDSRDAYLFAEAKKLIQYFKSDSIGAIAISIGPGMFTSLRVGLSLAKGLALARDLPVVAVNTLDVIGLSMSFSVTPVLAAINAFHQEIYAALYRKGQRITDYLLTTPEQVGKDVKEETLVVGSGVEVFKKSRLALKSRNLSFVDDDFLLPTASKVVKIALPRIQDGEFEDPETLEPFYIKRTDAERNYDKINAR